MRARWSGPGAVLSCARSMTPCAPDAALIRTHLDNCRLRRANQRIDGVAGWGEGTERASAVLSLVSGRAPV